MVKYPSAVVLVFCKAPIPGQVKTRLCPPLTSEQAAELHRELTLCTLKTIVEKDLCPLQLWCLPTVDHPFFLELAQTYRAEFFQQTGDDLGERMNHAINTALTAYSYAIVLGCDCPSLTPNDIEVAIAQLAGHDCVIAPAEDGGYGLIGLKQPTPFLFEDMPWGTGEVMTISQERLKQQGVSHKVLRTVWDVDTPADLTRYQIESNNDFFNFE